MTLGMVVRADDGGLGAQTWEIFRHLHPERVLIVHSQHTTRGRAKVERFRRTGCDLRITPRSPTPPDARWLCQEVDTVFTAETWYGPAIPHAARRRGVRLVIQANPEMDRKEPADVTVAATDWRLDTLAPGAWVLPLPVAMEWFEPQPFDPDLLSHVFSTAMWDRNGTLLLLRALEFLRKPVKVVIQGGEKHIERVARSEIHWLGHFDGPYYDYWPQLGGIFVLPRRFGGLCLPMQEAAACRLPIVTLDLPPQRGWKAGMGLVMPAIQGAERMPGGTITVFGANPRALAHQIDRFRGPKGAEAAESALEWARSLSWDVLLPEWEALLRG